MSRTKSSQEFDKTFQSHLLHNIYLYRHQIISKDVGETLFRATSPSQPAQRMPPKIKLWPGPTIILWETWLDHGCAWCLRGCRSCSLGNTCLTRRAANPTKRTNTKCHVIFKRYWTPQTFHWLMSRKPQSISVIYQGLRLKCRGVGQNQWQWVLKETENS